MVSSVTEIHKALVSEHFLHFLSHLKCELLPAILIYFRCCSHGLPNLSQTLFLSYSGKLK